VECKKEKKGIGDGIMVIVLKIIRMIIFIVLNNEEE
jgi:hypothetical protein